MLTLARMEEVSGNATVGFTPAGQTVKSWAAQHFEWVFGKENCKGLTCTDNGDDNDKVEFKGCFNKTVKINNQSPFAPRGQVSQ